MSNGDTEPLPTVPAPQSPAGPGGGRGRPSGWMVPTVVGLAVAVVMGAIGAGWMLASQRAELRELRGDVSQLRSDVAEAEERLEALRGDDGESGGLLDGLIEGLSDLDGLLDGGVGMDPSTVACMQPPADVDLPAVPDDGVNAQIAAIGEAVERLRGLRFDGEPPVTFSPGDEFVDELRRVAAEDYPVDDAAVDAARLAALGAIPEGTDLRQMQLDLVGDQAAGFYRPDTGEVVIRGEGDGSLTATERIILAHELEHALVDEQIGLPDTGQDAEDIDQAGAHLSAIEGGAVLVQHQFTMGTLDLGDQIELSTDAELQQQVAQLDEFPHFLQRNLLFPYEEGFAFACGHYRQGGLAALDDLVADPPASTAEVLFGNRGPQGRPEGPELGSLPSPWTQADTSAFGAAELMWLLEAPGDDPDAALGSPAQRAAGWDGGTVATWTDGDDTAVGLALAQRDGEPDLCDTMAAWHAAAFPEASARPAHGDEVRAARGGGRAGVVACDGGAVRVGLAADLDLARRLTR